MTTRKKFPADTRRTRTLRRGYILVVILGFTAVVTALGIAFLESSTTAMPEAGNRLYVSRAQYLAESGVNLAQHYLMYPPTTVSTGNYWTGANSVAIDTTNDYSNVTVTRDGTYKDQFVIQSIGYAKDFDQKIRGKKTITTRVIAPTMPKWSIPYALMNKSSELVPWGARIYGDLHVNGALVGSVGSWCNGKLTATTSLIWWGGGPPISSTIASTFTAPAGVVTNYATYKLNGSTYAANAYAGAQLRTADAATLNATNMSATNPGRIILANRNDKLRIRDPLSLSGTLVVSGDLEIDATGVVITALTDYPALVVSGNIAFTRDSATLNVIGSVICGGSIQDKDKNDVRLDVTGSFVGANGFSLSKTSGIYSFRWDQNRSSFWRFDGQNRQPITVLSWKEN